MKTIKKLGLYGSAAIIAAIVGGCATEKITVDYVMPAKAIKDVSRVNVVAIKVNANVKGNLAGDQKLNAGLVKQLLAMRLYKEGFYQVTDDIWSDVEKADALGKLMYAKNPNHGYGETFMAGGQSAGKVMIELDLDMSLDSKQTTKEMSFTCSTIPYKMKPAKPGEMPISTPDEKAIVVQDVKKPVSVFEVLAKGTLKAKFVGLDGGKAPEEYANSFEIKMPEADRFDSAQPSQLKALAAAVTPAINGVVADISPYKESRELEAIEGGDERVVHLLNAKAFSEVETVVEKLAVTGKANFADYENMGIAQEAMGEFHVAKNSYQAAAKANPESASAKDGLKRVADALSGKEAVKASDAKQNRDTKFSK